VWQVLPGGQCAPLSLAEDLLGETEALVADVKLLFERSCELMEESRRLVAVSQMPASAGRRSSKLP
jgi:hypothetical protein